MSEPRPDVLAYADAMELRLKANDHKGGWKDCSTVYLVQKLLEETAELIRALPDFDWEDQDLRDTFTLMLLRVRKTKTESKIHEAADVGNIAMMLADPERNLV